MKIFGLNVFIISSSVLCLSFSFNTDGTKPDTVKDIDGNIYHTVTIGSQVWMVENLKTTHYNDGKPITRGTDSAKWKYNTAGAYCDYNNKPSNSNIYGRLYNWYAVNSSHKICPKGWHVPSDDEWKTLINYIGGQDGTGGKLKDTGTTHWKTPNIGATNEAGFSALPGGIRNYSGRFSFIGVWGMWWSSTDSKNHDPWRVDLYYYSTYIGRNNNTSKEDGYSIRCIKD